MHHVACLVSSEATKFCEQRPGERRLVALEATLVVANEYRGEAAVGQPQLGCLDQALPEVSAPSGRASQQEQQFEQSQVAARGVSLQLRVSSQSADLQQTGDPSGRGPKQPRKLVELLDLRGQVAYVALQGHLDVVLKPARPALWGFSGEHFRIPTGNESPRHRAPAGGRTSDLGDAPGEHRVDERLAPPQDLALGEWPQLQTLGATGERLGDPQGRPHVRGARQQEHARRAPAPRACPIHATLDRGQQLNGLLELVDHDRQLERLHEPGRVGIRRRPRPRVIERHLTGVALPGEELRQRTLARLPGSHDHDHRRVVHRRIQPRLHVAFEELRVRLTDTQILADGYARWW